MSHVWKFRTSVADLRPQLGTDWRWLLPSSMLEETFGLLFPTTCMTQASAIKPLRTLGRYALFDEIAAGGMATVHLGRLIGPVGFSRTVAIKRLHSHFAKDPEFAAGFVDEARLAARIHHPNVVPIIDVLQEDGELSLVMDYVEGDSLAKLLRQTNLLKEKIPLPIVSAIICGGLYGLHAAHEAVDERGCAMHMVHRDISPQNILVGVDGVPRIVDFGVAKAAQRLQTTAEGQVKGKIAYMSPEQIRQGEVSRQADVYSMGVVLWETLTSKRLFNADNQAHLMSCVLEARILPPSVHRKECAQDLDKLVLKALSTDLNERHRTAREMAQALQRAVPPAPPTDVSDFIQSLGLDGLTDRKRMRARMESQAFLDDSEVEVFVPRPLRADEPTLVERPSRHIPPEDSAHAVTGTIAAPRNQSRLFLPLVLGLGVVLGGIIMLLVGSSPELRSASENTASQPLPSSRPREALAPDALVEPATALEPATTVEAQAPIQPQSPIEPRPDLKDNGDAPSEASAPLTQKTSPAPSATAKSPAPCPKFIEDADGIRRINRKCW